MRTKNMESQVVEIQNPGLYKLFIDELKDLYNAENQLIKAAPKMVDAAVSDRLKMVFEEHLEETTEHINRLEEILTDLDEKSTGVKCEGMEGLIKEAEKSMKKKEKNGAVKDAGLIAAVQKIEHYEIAGYGTVRTYAQILGFHEIAVLLQETLDEEGEADKILTAISEDLLGCSC